MKRILFAPNGARITGILEVLTVTAELNGFEYQNGRVVPEYAGQSNVDWDSQTPVLRDGKFVFIDEQGNEWSESQVLILAEMPQVETAVIIVRCAYTGRLPQPHAPAADCVEVPVFLHGGSFIVARDVPMRDSAQVLDGHIVPGQRMRHRFLFHAGHVIHLTDDERARLLSAVAA